MRSNTEKPQQVSPFIFANVMCTLPLRHFCKRGGSSLIAAFMNDNQGLANSYVSLATLSAAKSRFRCYGPRLVAFQCLVAEEVTP